MKIKTNFVAGVQPLLAPLAIVVWSTAFIVFAGLLWLIFDGIATRKELPGLKQRLTEIEPTLAVRSKQELPAEHELRQTRQQVARLNAITQSKGLSTLALLAKLESLLPDDTVLAAVHHRAKEGELLLLAQGANAELLSKFLQRLEEDEQLEAVVLTHQKEVKDGEKIVVQFEIHARVRS
jgi:ribosomal protein L29